MPGIKSMPRPAAYAAYAGAHAAR